MIETDHIKMCVNLLEQRTSGAMQGTKATSRALPAKRRPKNETNLDSQPLTEKETPEPERWRALPH